MSTLKVNTIQDTTGNDALTIDSSGNVTASQGFVPSTQLSHRNLIINGDFQVWQRGTSSTASNDYDSADRWKQYTVGVGGATFAKNSDGNMHITVTGSGSGTARIGQIIEFPEKYHGKTVTFSAMVKSNNSNARLLIDSNSQWYTETDAHSGGGDWEQLKLTATIESSGLTFLRFNVGLDGVQSANVSLTSSDYVTIKEVQLEVGSVATPFEHRSYGEELARCQRYFFSAPLTNRLSWPNGVSVAGGTFIGTRTHFPVTMRAAPSITENDVSVDASPFVTSASSSITVDGFNIRVYTGSSTSSYFNKNLSYTADAEL